MDIFTPLSFLKINNLMIENKYSIPTGWNGYGLSDLTKMVNEGDLTIISESEQEPDTLEKTIIFKSNSNKQI
jgi:hypothetical protein